MSSSGSPSGDGSSATTAQRLPSASDSGTTTRRRLSLEEDFFYYQEVITAEPRPPSEQPPPYRPYKARSKITATAKGKGNAVPGNDADTLPAYSTDIYLEGLFDKKMELVDATRPAHDRQWRTTLVELHGTSLRFYAVKKEWGWGMAREWAANPTPDKPPWAKRNGLLKKYNLQHADVGIAADYRKRRNVIRLRVETDQFLIACVEATTFARWLDGLFAALAIAHPLEERDFPVDQSVPRSQRSRWLRAQRQLTPPRPRYPVPTSRPLSQLRLEESDTTQLDGVQPSAGIFGALAELNAASAQPGRPYSMSLSSSLLSLSQDIDIDVDPWPSSEPQSPAPGQTGSPLSLARSASSASPAPTSATTPTSSLSRTPSLRHPANRRSTTASPTHRPPTSAATPPSELSRPQTSGIDRPPSRRPEAGKWRPHHQTPALEDDLRHGRLCYAILLFASPRKSNYVVKHQTKWFVDWETGRMVRVLPPTYSESDKMNGEQQARRTHRRLSVGVGMAG